MVRPSTYSIYSGIGRGGSGSRKDSERQSIVYERHRERHSMKKASLGDKTVMKGREEADMAV